MPHASNLTFVTAAALSATAWLSATAAVFCWLCLVVAANLLWRRSRIASRSLTIACVAAPALWVLPPVGLLGASVLVLLALKLRHDVSQRSVTTRTSA